MVFHDLSENTMVFVESSPVCSLRNYIRHSYSQVCCL